MKTSKLNIVRLSLLSILLVLIAAPSAYAETVTTKTRWLMGYECTTENSYDRVWSTTQVAAEKSTRTINDLTITITSTGSSDMIHTAQYLYGKKSVSFSLDVKGPGTLYIEAQQCTSNGADGGKERTVTVKQGSTEIGEFIYNSTKQVQTVSVTGGNDDTNTITITTNDHIRWYAFKWTPTNAPKEDLNLTLSIPAEDLPLYVGGEANVVATGASAAIIGALTYTSSNTGILTVDNKGKITGVAKGTATVTAHFAGNDDYNEYTSAPLSVTVNKMNLTSTVNVDKSTIAVGEEALITLTYYDPEGNVVAVGSNFSSGNSSVAKTVSGSSGRIEGVSEGTATITIYSKNHASYENKHDAVTITVVKATPEIKTNSGGPVSDWSGQALGLDVETSADLAGKFKVLNGTKDITDQGTLTFTTNLTLSGTVLSSTTARSDGTLTVTWTPSVTGKYNQVSATINNIEVKNAALKDLTMTVSPTSLELKVGQTSSAITAQYSYEGSAVTRTTKFSSSDTSVATVDQNTGVVTAVKAGTATITAAFEGDATYNPVSQTVEVTVTKRDITLTANPASISVKENSKANISVTLSETVESPEYTYTSANEEIANVNSQGRVTGVVQGSTTIKVKFKGNDTYNECETTVSVTVTDDPLFEYLGYNLSADMRGDLKDASKTTMLHYKFGAPDDEDIYVFKLNTKKDIYEFMAENLTLKTEAQNCENHFDDFYKTVLTANNGGGDGFTEYNGMIGGYGTENGGRYLTPISGTFIRVEALYDGVVTVTLRHNGGTDNSAFTTNDDEHTNVRCARRPLYVMDENGVIMKRTTNYANVAAGTDAITTINGTYAFIKSDSKVNDRFNVVNDKYTAWFANPTAANSEALGLGKGFDYDFSKNAFSFIRNVIYSDIEDFNATVRENFNQRLYYSADDTDVYYQDENVGTATEFFAKYGYEVLSATQLSISFPVKAGKTYFVGANKSKVALCTIEFTRTQPTTTVPTYELNEGATSTPSWIKSTTTGTNINVTLKRTFQPGQWHPIILPFSVSESALKEAFGPNVAVIALDGALKMLSSKNNYATRDIDKPGNDPRAFTGSVIKDPAVKDGSVTFTRHYYQMIYANCPVFICPDPELEAPVTNYTFKNVTFVKPDLDASNDEAVILPFAIDRQIGDGETYHYSMVAMYHATTKSENANREMYYVSNTGTGSSAVATLYHAEKGNAPAMKGMRVWIEPASDRYTPPIRTIKVANFCDMEGYDTPNLSAIEDVVCDTPLESFIDDDTVYDIYGRAVSHGTLQGLAPGIYIYQGRKHYVK